MLLLLELALLVLLAGGATWVGWCRILKMPVPMGMGTPMMMHSDTPTMASCRECTAASNR